MPDESEVIHADVFVEFSLPNGRTLYGKPVPYPEARKILAQMCAFDRTGDYEGVLVPALESFSAVSGLTDEHIMAACSNLSLGELTTAIQRFFFQRRPIPGNGAAPANAAAAGA
jgi:hypothetical protein